MSYTAIVLDPESRNIILSHLPMPIPAGWKIVADHMTIEMNKPVLAAEYLGQKVELSVNSFAANDKVMAVGVETAVPSTREQKHITVAVNYANGGKPFLSNLLTYWEPIQSFKISGVVEEVDQ